MKKRLEAFGDVIFGALLASCVAFLAFHFAVKGHVDASMTKTLLPLLGLFYRIAIMATFLWTVQTLTLRYCYIDHAVYWFFYLVFLLMVIAWAGSNALGVDVVHSALESSPSQVDKLTSDFANATSFTVNTASILLIVLMILGTAYHWSFKEPYEIYRRLRLIVVALAGVAYSIILENGSAAAALNFIVPIRVVPDYLIPMQIASMFIALLGLGFTLLEHFLKNVLYSKNQLIDYYRKAAAGLWLLLAIMLVDAVYSWSVPLPSLLRVMFVLAVLALIAAIVHTNRLVRELRQGKAATEPAMQPSAKADRGVDIERPVPD